MEESLDKNISIKITIDDIKSFQDNVGIPFVSKLKINISSRFSSQDVMSAFSIIDPKKKPKVDFSKYTNYGNHFSSALLNQYGSPRTTIALDGQELRNPALITNGVHAEWTTFHHYYMAKEPKENMLSQLNSLLTNDMLKTMFPICIPWPMFA